MNQNRAPIWGLLPIVLAMVLALGPAAATRGRASPSEGLVRVAMLKYGIQQKTSHCFSNAFMKLLATETDIRLDGSFDAVELESEQIYDYPFAIMTGEGSFELTEAEVQNLRRFLQRGGFLLASAGCSNPAWNESFKKVLERTLPEAAEKELTLSHPVFQTVYQIREFQSKKPRTKVRIYGIEIDGRLAVVRSPEGLNDTQNAGGGCCCCGGNEIRNAKFINANVLVYALMH